MPIPSEDRVVGHPAMTAVSVRFPDNDPHVREEVNDAPGVALCQDGDVSREARDPGEQRRYLSLLGAPNARTCGEGFQAFGQSYVVWEQISHFHKFERPDALHQLCGHRGETAG